MTKNKKSNLSIDKRDDSDNNSGEESLRPEKTIKAGESDGSN